MKKLMLSLVLIFTLMAQTQAQDLLSPSTSFSHKKTAYITLMDGTEVKCTIKKISRKKGLIQEIKVRNEAGKKVKYKPNEIAYMYLPPSGLDKLGKAMDFLGDAKKWTDEKLEQDLLNQGYVYFEQSDVKLKKKTKSMLMQLLNPGFSVKVKVYHDPWAKETMSLGVGAVKVVGGIAKSYYVKLDTDKAAFRLKKKNYRSEFKLLWKSCPAVKESVNAVKWNEFTKHIITYTECEK